MDRLDNILFKVAKPGRYTGGEWNSIVKDWSQVKVKIALIFPDSYEIGMSNMAIPILYEIINAQPDILVERAFAPWKDMELEVRSTGRPLYRLEPPRPL